MEITIGLENESILKIGAAYSTFKEFEDAFNTWADAGHHPMSRIQSNRNNNTLQTDHPYATVSYVCKHHGTPRRRGKNIRPNQRYFSQGCPVVVKVNLNLRPMKYIVRQLFAEHNHLVSAELRAQYPDRRLLLDTRAEKTLTQLVEDNVKPKDITTVLTKNFGKTMCTKDIHNIKKRRLELLKERIAKLSCPLVFPTDAQPNVPDRLRKEKYGQVIVKNSEHIGSVYHVKDKDNQLKAPVVYVNKRKNTCSTSLVQGEDASVKVEPVSQVNVPVIHVKKNDSQIHIPISHVGKMIMVQTKPINVKLIRPSLG